MLESEGFVFKGLQGIQVAELSLEEVTEIFEALADLEELYTRRAAHNLTDGDIKEMAALLRQMEGSAKQNDIQKYFQLNDEFHLIIRNACSNRQLIRLFDSLGKKTYRVRRFAMSLTGRLPESLEEHRQILIAIRKKDAEGAGRRARDSAEKAYRAVTEFLTRAPLFVLSRASI